MREALRKVAEEVAAVGIDFFGVEPDVVGAADEVFHERCGVAPLTEECSFCATDAVVAGVRADKRARTERARVDTNASTGTST